MDWKRKLASRKFWALLGSFVGALLVAFNMSDNDIAQVAAIISAFGSVVVYILAEASIDKEAVKKESDKNV